MIGYSRDENLADARMAARLFHALDRVPVPLIGRVTAPPSAAAPASPPSATSSSPADDAVFGFTEVVWASPRDDLSLCPRKIGGRHLASCS